VINENDSFLE
jgi:hypothetical protein